ncbi:MAG: recombinase RecT [Candidatus Omnitrophota bacterium]
MANLKDVKTAVSNGTEMTTTTKPNSLETLLKSINVRSRFDDMLGKKSAGFISSILSIANQSKMLKLADPVTIISAAAVAASLDLPINPSLGFAHIVPYRDGKTGRTIAQFQMGWKGFVQLAMRSGQYKTMNVAVVYEGELKKHDRITGLMDFDLTAKSSDNIIGYVAYFKLLNGFEKYCYITKENAEKHGKRYSKSYETGQWTKDFDAMAKKTTIKQLLSKFGVLSIDMQRAIESDQAVIKEDGTPEYVDNPSGEIIDAEAVPAVDEKGEEIPFGEEKK